MKIRVSQQVDVDTEVNVDIDDIQAALREHLDNARDAVS